MLLLRGMHAFAKHGHSLHSKLQAKVQLHTAMQGLHPFLLQSWLVANVLFYTVDMAAAGAIHVQVCCGYSDS